MMRAITHRITSSTAKLGTVIATTSSSELIEGGDSVVGTVEGSVGGIVKGSVVGKAEGSVAVGSVGTPQVVFPKSVCPSQSGIPSAIQSASLSAPVRNIWA